MNYDPIKVYCNKKTSRRLGKHLSQLAKKELGLTTKIEFIALPMLQGSIDADVSIEIIEGDLDIGMRKTDKPTLQILKSKFIDAMSLVEGLVPPPNDQKLIELIFPTTKMEGLRV